MTACNLSWKDWACFLTVMPLTLIVLFATKCDGHLSFPNDNFYPSLLIKQQLASLLANTDVTTALSERLRGNSEPHTSTKISDITDVSVYKACPSSWIATT